MPAGRPKGSRVAIHQKMIRDFAFTIERNGYDLGQEWCHMYRRALESGNDAFRLALWVKAADKLIPNAKPAENEIEVDGTQSQDKIEEAYELLKRITEEKLRRDCSAQNSSSQSEAESSPQQLLGVLAEQS